jgi:hypothetical protein
MLSTAFYPLRIPVDKDIHNPCFFKQQLILVDIWGIKQIKKKVVNNRYQHCLKL